MKQFFLLFGLLWATASRAQAPTAAAGAAAGATLPGIQALDAKNGFRGYTLGEPIANYPNLKRRGPAMYEARNEPLKLGDVRLFMLLFGADGERLTSINLVALGKADATKLLAALQAQYGEGVPDERGRVRWHGAKVGMVYQYTVSHSGGGTNQDITGSVTMYSLEFAQAVKKTLGEP
jgi:hypothetical protein